MTLRSLRPLSALIPAGPGDGARPSAPPPATVAGGARSEGLGTGSSEGPRDGPLPPRVRRRGRRRPHGEPSPAAARPPPGRDDSRGGARRGFAAGAWSTSGPPWTGDFDPILLASRRWTSVTAKDDQRTRVEAEQARPGYVELQQTQNGTTRRLHTFMRGAVVDPVGFLLRLRARPPRLGEGPNRPSRPGRRPAVEDDRRRRPRRFTGGRRPLGARHTARRTDSSPSSTTAARRETGGPVIRCRCGWRTTKRAFRCDSRSHWT